MSTRCRIVVTGAVQGVGFRPFSYRLASELRLSGWVRNAAAGVELEVEGAAAVIERFVARLDDAAPCHARIDGITRQDITPLLDDGFRILPSDDSNPETPGEAEILPDLATCSECLAEILDPSDRRHAYPFTNCIHCGPRFSIVTRRPWDREHTTMRGFTMCPACRSEYQSPRNRRFHAQPNACPECGPQLLWLGSDGSPGDRRHRALERAARVIEEGGIIALKGIGGFLLLTDARSPATIAELRRRKHRPSKPLALLMPSLATARLELAIDAEEARWLGSAAAPILLLARRTDSQLPEDLAPGNPLLGAMLPHSPLHHLLMRRLDFPVVATSGNLSGEPICIDNEEAVQRLAGIADGFLVHDRPIARPVDDSVARVVDGELLMLRRARGFAPASLPATGVGAPVLACGGDLKNAIALAGSGRVLLGQHLGDLSSAASRSHFAGLLHEFPRLFGSRPEAIACDPHPAYHGSNEAEATGLPLIHVQHHHAHAAACAAENDLGPDEEYLAVVWDGTGYGSDGTLWGGEFLLCRNTTFRRFAWLRPFALPGGEKAVRDPRFAALGCLHEAGIPLPETGPLAMQLTAEERRIARGLIERDLQAPRSSSAGRLFDAVSALCGLCRHNEHEGQAAMALEHAASPDTSVSGYSVDRIAIRPGAEIDWTPILRCVIDDLQAGHLGIGEISRRFHLALVGLITRCAACANLPCVALSGGCFQNTLLLELASSQLRAAGHRPLRHHQVPPNDGGLAFGQAVIASRLLSQAPQ